MAIANQCRQRITKWHYGCKLKNRDKLWQKLRLCLVIEITVHGVPVPKQSFRISGHGGYRDPRVTAWQLEVTQAAIEWLKANGTSFGLAFDGKYHMKEPAFKSNLALDVTIDFFMPDRRRVDLDNLSKAVLDALNGCLWEDDRQIVRMLLTKVMGVGKSNAGVMIKVQEIDL